VSNLRCQTGEVDGCAVLVARGELGRREARLLDRMLAKLVLDRGRVFVDVSELTATWSPALALFPTVLANAGGWPLARLVLVAPNPDLRRALRASRISAVVQVAEDWPQAHRLVEARPSMVSRWRDIPSSADAGLVARAATWEVCQDWGLTSHRIPAAVVATELVFNAIRHAGTPCRLTLTLHRYGLRISVRDRRPPSEADLVSIRAQDESCHGLAVVASLARSWGVIPQPGGKTVWAVLTQP